MNLGSLKPFFEPHLLSEIDRFGIVKQVKKGDILIDIGEQIQFIPLIIEGAVKVLREDASGDEILLYFVDFGNKHVLYGVAVRHYNQYSIKP